MLRQVREILVFRPLHGVPVVLQLLEDQLGQLLPDRKTVYKVFNNKLQLFMLQLQTGMMAETLHVPI